MYIHKDSSLLFLSDPEVLDGDGDVSAVVDGVVPRRPQLVHVLLPRPLHPSHLRSATVRSAAVAPPSSAASAHAPQARDGAAFPREEAADPRPHEL